MCGSALLALWPNPGTVGWVPVRYADRVDNRNYQLGTVHRRSLATEVRDVPFFPRLEDVPFPWLEQV
jgi:hypothetical protein